MRNRRVSKAQSAMEYLMTYGWAILIIAVVLGALFSLGVFSGGSLLGNACVAGAGFLCSGQQLGTTGNIIFTFGQSTGATMYNIGMACVATSTSSGLPNPATAMVTLTPTGAANAVYSNTVIGSGSSVNLEMTSGQTITVSGLKCYDASGTAMNSTTAPIGTSFSGTLYINYTASSGGVTGANPVLTQKFATLTTKVV